MTILPFRSRLARTALVGLMLAASAPCATRAWANEASERHQSWRGCLDRNFGLQATLTGRILAADSALRACREAEAAYLAALSASPLLDDDEVAEARPALVARTRVWLLGRRAAL